MGYGHSTRKEVLRYDKQFKPPVLPEPPELPKPSDNLLVVIANFEPIPSTNVEAKENCETIPKDLERMIKQKIASGVPLEYPIMYKQQIEGKTEKEKRKNAKDIGHHEGAHLVLWGSVQFTEMGGEGEFYLEPRITVVQPLGPVELEEKQPGELRVSLAHPEILELRRRKIEEIADIVSFIHGLAFYNQQKYEDAINIFKGVISPHAEISFYHGTALIFLSRFEEAIKQYDKALEINPNLADAYLNRGNAYYNKGENDRAILDFNKALEINSRYAEAYNNRGSAYDKKGEYDRAILDFNKALEINPRYAEAYNNRGVAYKKKGSYDLAISDYNKALEINPRYAEAYYNRAVAYYYKGEYDKAWEDVHKAQGLGYQVNPEILKLLSEASGRQR
ncbi:MAG TPA: tetratricopeptide repeat protein [Candidatus Brocadiia bacterium]|nr:tetratricopeptide repeat protein [Candidatus Brocadiales bacterium]